MKIMVQAAENIGDICIEIIDTTNSARGGQALQKTGGQGFNSQSLWLFNVFVCDTPLLAVGQFNLIKKGKVDKSNIIKRNSGYDSTGIHVNLSKEGKKVMTVVYQLNDKENNPISDSFLWRSKGMTEAIQKELGDKALDEISYNSKDGEYMIDEKGNNIYHKNSLELRY